MILPFAVISLVLAVWKLENVMETRNATLDYLSVLLSVVGFGGLLYGCSMASSDGWSDKIVLVSLIGGAIGIVDAEHGKLEVSFLPEGLRWVPFTKGDYWVLKLDEQYETALVGEPHMKYLWLLHRKPTLDEATKQQYLAYAESLGYDLSDLIHTVHTGQPTA